MEADRPTNPQDGEASAQLLRWQERLLPFTTWFMVGLAVVFVACAVFELVEARSILFATDTSDIRSEVKDQFAKQPPHVPSLEENFQRSLVLLEADVLDRRYHQASALTMARLWMKHLAFMTGMAMAFLGALFILSKIAEATSTIQIEGRQLKTAISSASPGIILSFLGTTLLIVALLVSPAITVTDAPVYVRGLPLSRSPKQEAMTTKPRDIIETELPDVVDNAAGTVHRSEDKSREGGERHEGVH